MTTRPVWDGQKALSEGKAKTRDGRSVIDLKQYTIDNKVVLIGTLIKDYPPYSESKFLDTIRCVWEGGGLSSCGNDDLVNC